MVSTSPYHRPDLRLLPARRLSDRSRHYAELFTFLEHPEAPSDNYRAERQIRPAVIVRKNNYANGHRGRSRDTGDPDERVPESRGLTCPVQTCLEQKESKATKRESPA